MKFDEYMHEIETYERGYEWRVRGLTPSPSMASIYKTMRELLQIAVNDPDLKDLEFKELFIRAANLRYKAYKEIR